MNHIINTTEELVALPRLSVVHSGWGNVYHSNFPTQGKPVVWWSLHGSKVDPHEIRLPALVLDGPVTA